MNWEKLTSPAFEKAVKTCKGVCLIPAGVIEKHGDHLPLGQDALYIHRICTLAAQQEPAMVFPFYYFGQILEAKHVPGTIAIHHNLLLTILENICDEISRNGFKKIIIVNGHGGNIALHSFFTGTMLLDKKKDYAVYISDPWFKDTTADSIKEAKVDGHGGERETSCSLYFFPELVDMKNFASYGMPLGRLKAFQEAGLQSGVGWYSDQPGHFKSDSTKGTREKGKIFTESHVKHVIRQIRLVKKDDTPLRLYKEFHQRALKPANVLPPKK
jgi:creatinine amidohydrolase